MLHQVQGLLLHLRWSFFLLEGGHLGHSTTMICSPWPHWGLQNSCMGPLTSEP